MCAELEISCAPPPKWAARFIGPAMDSKAPRRPSAACEFSQFILISCTNPSIAIFTDLAPSLSGVEPRLATLEVKMEELRTVTYNLDHMMRILCRKAGVSPSSLDLTVVPVPRYSSSTGLIPLSTSSALSTSVISSSGLDLSRMSITDPSVAETPDSNMSVPGPSRGRAGTVLAPGMFSGAPMFYVSGC